MHYPEQRFTWTLELEASPEALWPLVSDTDRFNRDCGYPSVKVVPRALQDGKNPRRVDNARRLQASVFGMIVEWDELPFDWIQPRHFGVQRTYYRGPVARMALSCDLTARPGGGTTLVYEMRLVPAGLLGRLILPFSIGKRARATTENVFRRYDGFALKNQRRSQIAQKSQLAAGGADRLGAIGTTLVREAGQPADLVARLSQFVAAADDLSVARVRPYALADDWGAERRDTLKLFLHATRAGMLDFSWDLVCPHCRGAKAGPATLNGISPSAHCDSCNVDFTASFDQSVELTFIPNASIRSVTRSDYCVGGPQLTPHIVAQQHLPPSARRELSLALKPGRYRIRTPNLAEHYAFRVAQGAPAKIQIYLGPVPSPEPEVSPAGELAIANATESEHLAIVEHVAWSDQSTTAAEVTSLQLFRDLFSSEVLRQGEQISVGAMTIVFTDLKNSTQLYRDIGDAPAFGRVLTHFEILKAAVASENGAIVKTMGDAIMAVFPRPLAAMRAMLLAQNWLAKPTEYKLPAGVNVPPSSLGPLALKAGINAGPCLAINQNERLDYFGSTVNIASRLCSLCSGSDLLLSSSVRNDPEVADWLGSPGQEIEALEERATFKGYGDESFAVWRVKLHLGFSKEPFGAAHSQSPMSP